LVILAAEDIGLANPNALLLAQSTFDAVHKVGMPESRIILSECTIYLATCPKSNSAYSAINEAMAEVKASGHLPVPLHLRNAPTGLMKELGYGKEYKYSHSYENNFAEQDFLPEKIKKKQFYHPQNNNSEKTILERLKTLWKNRY
jgi:putative ATPase